MSINMNLQSYENVDNLMFPITNVVTAICTMDMYLTAICKKLHISFKSLKAKKLLAISFWKTQVHLIIKTKVEHQGAKFKH
jgi:hypothetical protein